MTSPAEFEDALQAARILLHSDQVRTTQEKAMAVTNEDKRDLLMAETVEYLL